MSNERVFQRAKVLIYGFGVPGCWQDWSCCRGALSTFLHSNCDSCPRKCRAEGGNGERTLRTNPVALSNNALQAEGFKGRTNSRAQADRTANFHLLSLCKLSVLPSGNSDVGAGVCCQVGASRLCLGTREREKRDTLLVRNSGPASLPGLVKGHVACWDQGQHHGSLGMQVMAFQLVV